MPVEVQRRFWRLMRCEALSVADAARRVGVAETTGQRWFREAGGVFPSLADQPSGYRLSARKRRSTGC